MDEALRGVCVGGGGNKFTTKLMQYMKPNKDKYRNSRLVGEGYLLMSSFIKNIFEHLNKRVNITITRLIHMISAAIIMTEIDSGICNSFHSIVCANFRDKGVFYIPPCQCDHIKRMSSNKNMTSRISSFTFLK